MASRSRTGKVRLDLFITLKQMESLKAISEITGQPISSLVRTEIHKLIEKTGIKAVVREKLLEQRLGRKRSNDGREAVFNC